MAAEQSLKAKAWAIFDRIIEGAAPGGVHSNPWTRGKDGHTSYEPDIPTLELLLGVPLQLKASTQTGVPALAIDVWLSYELRRAGFGADQTWPRATHPRVLPASVAKLLDALPRRESKQLRDRIERVASIKEVTASTASILGKNYLKQVDVIITDWATGPELLISTKRMDSSYAKNAPNRIEESYGDAKNLRLRHPLAALGFVFGLRSDILADDPGTAEWLFDLLEKLGREDDAYHFTALILMEYSDSAAVNDDGEEPREDVTRAPGVTAEDDTPPPTLEVVEAVAADDGALDGLPKVRVCIAETPEVLRPNRFLAGMVERVLTTAPVTMHKEARRRRAEARQL